jgi:hypothetical protein
MTYRSAEDALRERTETLETELRVLDDKRREATRLDQDVERVVADLAKSRELLDRFEKRRALPVLEDIKVASPCHARWDEMVGDEKSRHCKACDKHVFNLSAMTREEAELTMLEKTGELCIRLYRRADGTVITADCPVGVRRKRLRLVGVLAMGAGALASAAGYAALRESEREQPQVVMGGFGDDLKPVPRETLQTEPVGTAVVVPTAQVVPPVQPPPAASGTEVEMGKRAR